MSNESHIDKQFHERLHHAEVQPPAFVWTAVEQELQHRKRRAILYWAFGIGLVALVTAVTIYWGQPAAMQSYTELPSSENQQVGAVTAAPTQAPTNDKAGTEESQPQANVVTPDLGIEKGILPSKPVQKSLPSAQRTPALLSNLVGTNSPSKLSLLSDGAPASKKQITSASSGPIEVPSFVAPVSAIDAVLTTEDKPAILSPSVEQIQATPTSSESIALFTSTTPAPAANSQDIQPTAAPATPAPAQAVKTPIAVVQKTATPQPAPKFTKKNCYNFAERPNIWLLEAYGGLAKPFRSLGLNSSVATAEDQDDLDARNRTERQGWGFTTGIKASYLHQGKYWIGTGLDYTQFTEVFKNENLVSIEYLIKQKVDPNTGDIIGVDTVDAIFGKKTNLRYNRYGFLNLPFAIGYEIRHGRAGIQFRGGGAVNLAFWQRGSVLEPTSQEPTPLGTQKFKVTTGFHVEASAQAFWHCQPRTRLFVEPYYQRILQPVTSEQSAIQQRYNFLGLRAGISRIF